jgi:hypothetical protein
MGSIGRGVEVIYGHQGGWDEGLLVLLPITAIVVLLAVAKHRAEVGERGGAPPPDVPEGD